jgi:hypothetical protein
MSKVIKKRSTESIDNDMDGKSIDFVVDYLLNKKNQILKDYPDAKNIVFNKEYYNDYSYFVIDYESEETEFEHNKRLELEKREYEREMAHYIKLKEKFGDRI